jgi:tryptophan synthase alpha chain
MNTATSSRIEARFRENREHNRKGLVVYLTAGDPSLDATGELLAAIDRAGADVIELGIPFSDPLADGPVIQRASERALRQGATLGRVLQRLAEWRHGLRAPVILFGYYNPILRYGLERFASDAAQAGADGSLVVDLSAEEAAGYTAAMRAARLDTIFLASPTSTDERLRRIAALCSGFVYLVSRTGVTGERAELSAAVGPLIERIRRLSALPVAVGFGVSNRGQVRAVQQMADAAVVGSAVVRRIEELDRAGLAQGIEQFIRWLREGNGSAAQ